MANFYIFIGNYGSGKTELSLNFALKAAKEGKKTVLVDLDIVNPYFRSAEHEDLLKSNGIELIASAYARSGIDLPVVAAQVAKVFIADYDVVVFDVGGDTVGATALGQYFHKFEKIRQDVNCFYVVNVCRPLCRTSDEIVTLYNQIQGVSRMKITGFINNTNLARDTTSELLIRGQEVLAEVKEKTGIRTAYTSGLKQTLEGYTKLCEKPVGELFELEVFTRPAWLDSTC